MSKKKIIVIAVVIVSILAGGTYGFFYYAKNNKVTIGVKSLGAISKIASLLPIPADEKKEIEVVNKLVEAFTKNDNQERKFMVFLQNNMELRPGGGFLGQYGIIKIKNGQVVSSYFEDANLLDQRITAKISPPYPFRQMLQIKKWKFRDSNFSPDFPTNVEKSMYFYRLSGGVDNFDGYIAINADVLDHVLELTGPITVPGYPGEYTSENATLKLEEQVEKAYIMDPSLDSSRRKLILKQMAGIIIDKLTNLQSIPKVAEFVHTELKDKDIMLHFKDSELQTLAESVHWDGKVSQDWGGDYLMMVDSNMGAKKTDYYIKRSLVYNVDLTQERPTVDLTITYKNTATYGDWRTSDYHSYMRLFIPKGSTFVSGEMASYRVAGEDLGKTYFGFLVHTLINGETIAKIKYQLPADFPKDNYKLLIQKQSGVGEVPVEIHVKTPDGELSDNQVLKSDLKFEVQK